MKTKSIKFLLALFCAGILCSCVKDKKHDSYQNNLLKELVERRIVLPNGLEAYYTNKDSIGIFNWDEYASKKKIVTFINGDCFSCVEDLMMWEQLISDFDLKDVIFVFYIYIDPDQFEPVRKYTLKSGFSSVILIDKDNKFAQSNNIPITNKLLQAMLLDEANNTLVFGNPIYSSDLLQLYKTKLEI